MALTSGGFHIVSDTLVSIQYANLTDGQTDGQIAIIISIARRDKNHVRNG